MSVNNKPIFTGTPFLTVSNITSSANVYTLGSTNYTVIHSSSEDSYLQKIRVKLIDGTTAATVLKIILLHSNSHRILDEFYLPITQVTNSSTTPTYEITLNMPITSTTSVLAGYTVNFGTGKSISVTAIGGLYTYNNN